MTLGLAIGATFAEPIPKAFGKRALQDYVDVIEGINDQVNLVNTVFAAYTGGDATAVINAGDDLVAIINAGTADVGTFDPLTVPDGLALVSTITALIDDVNVTIDTTISKEGTMAANGYDDEVLANLKLQKTASEGLADAITGKTPEELKDIAAQLAAEIATAIQRGITAYSS